MNGVSGNSRWLKWVSLALTAISWIILPVIFILHSPLILNPSISSFSTYLGIITGLAGVLITITVFLVEATSQEYSSQLIRTTFFKQKQFAVILAYLFGALIFLTVGSAFEISTQVNFAGFIVAIGTVCNFIAILLLSIYYMNILNIISEIEGQTLSYLKKKAKPKQLWFIGEVSFDTLSERTVINQLVPLFDTLRKSVERNQNDLSVRCLQSVDRIILEYLKGTAHFKAIDDAILREVSDQISFLIDAAVKSGNQKFMDKLPILIGNIGVYALKYRYRIGGVNNHATHYSNLLVVLFTRSYNYDRTAAPKTSMNAIANLVKTCIYYELYQSESTYYYDLVEIRKFCLASPNRWSAILLSHSLNLQKQIIHACVLTVRSGKTIRIDFYNWLFSDIYKTLSKATNFSAQHFDIIIRAVFNLESLLITLIREHPQIPVNKPLPNSIFKVTVEAYVNLCIEIVTNKKIDPDFMFLNSLPEFAYYTEYVQSAPEILTEYHQLFLSGFISRLESMVLKDDDTSAESSLYERMVDYFAILIHARNVSLTRVQVHQLLSFFRRIREKTKNEYALKKTYRLLKIVGAFMEGEGIFEDTQKEIADALLPEFEEPDLSGFKGFNSVYQEYDYDISVMDWDGWHITPLTIWLVQFTEEINQHMNTDNQSKFIKFHEKLRARANSQKQRTR